MAIRYNLLRLAPQLLQPYRVASVPVGPRRQLSLCSESLPEPCHSTCIHFHPQFCAERNCSLGVLTALTSIPPSFSHTCCQHLFRHSSCSSLALSRQQSSSTQALIRFWVAFPCP